MPSPLEQRDISKRKIENLEIWLRRIIHDLFTKSYGANYWDSTFNDVPLINTRIKKGVESRISGELYKSGRKIDALMLDDVVSIILRTDLWNEHFSDVLKSAFPTGTNSARTVFERLIEIRNDLSHARPISEHDYLRVMCYSEDVLSTIKAYFLKTGMNQIYNVPQIIRMTDSKGQTWEISEEMHVLRSAPEYNYLYVGETIWFEVEIDPSWKTEEYHLDCRIGNNTIEASENNGIFHIEHTLTNADIHQDFWVRVNVIQNRDWHKMGSIDDFVQIKYSVAPNGD